MSNPNQSTPANTDDSRRVLVTGATSGLGFEAAAQLAEAGYGPIVITGRTQAKADRAKSQLTGRVGRDVFETLAVDVADVADSRRAAAELVDRGQHFDRVLLNAGAILTSRQITPEGLEGIFAASIIGHHVLITELVEADLLAPGARVVIVGSEAANDDMPKVMGFSVADFALRPASDDETFKANLKAFARGEEPVRFDANDQYATTKTISAWWAAEQQRRHGGTIDFFNVSPGANLGTDAARHQTGAMKMMFSLMGRFGHLVGMNQPVPEGARRYVDVLTATGSFTPGATYTSRPKKMTGPLTQRNEPHLVDERRQRLAVTALDELVAAITSETAAT